MLIDSNKLKEYYSWWSDEPNKKLFDDIIDRQPEAVVRCMDCKHWDKEDSYCDFFSGSGAYWSDPDDYCSCGERRTNVD